MRGGKCLEGEIERLPVLSRQKHVADFPAIIALFLQVSQRVEITQGFRHLFAVHAQVGAMEPCMHKGLARGALRLGYFIFMVRKHVVDAACMNVEALPQVFHGHGRTLDMPARAAATPWGIPPYIAIVLIPGLPDGEVANCILLILVVRNANT